MPDLENVIKGLECCLKESDHLYSNPCNGCPYEGQECIDRIKADALAMLKEQKPVKPVLDERTGRIWLCGNCGSYVGFEDHDENDPNEFDNFCRKCGRPVLWEGR